MLVNKFYYKKYIQNQNEWGFQECFRYAGFFFCKARNQISSIDEDILVKSPRRRHERGMTVMRTVSHAKETLFLWYFGRSTMSSLSIV